VGLVAGAVAVTAAPAAAHCGGPSAVATFTGVTHWYSQASNTTKDFCHGTDVALSWTQSRVFGASTTYTAYYTNSSGVWTQAAVGEVSIDNGSHDPWKAMITNLPNGRRFNINSWYPADVTAHG
jgi:hypothetical protein